MDLNGTIRDETPHVWPGPAGTVRLAVLLAVLAIVLYLTWAVFQPFVLMFATAAPVAMLMTPTQERLAAGLGNRKSLAAAILVIWTLLIVAIPFTGVLTLLAGQAVNFFSWLGPQLEPAKVQTFLKETLPSKISWFGPLWETLEPYVAPTAAGLLAQISRAVQVLLQRLATGIGATMVEISLFFLFLFFFLRDGRTILGLVRSLSPLSSEQENRVIEHLRATSRGAILGVVVVPIAQGAAAMLGYWIFGVPNALLWGSVTVLACLIPLLGAPIVWVPISIFLFFTGPLWKAIGLFVYGAAVISSIDNILKPMLLSGAARVHPLLGFLAVIGGTLAFGPAGLLVGPIVLSLAISALHIYRTDFLVRWGPSGAGTIGAPVAPDAEELQVPVIVTSVDPSIAGSATAPAPAPAPPAPAPPAPAPAPAPPAPPTPA
ncbi:MAG TPA: AI-2E family transporter [Candidatus Eisenbacteria bacterium]|nr:AI-2E family transporter [Candidatus Eisenbacteria bacterium]